jgi:hypothetical protein
MTSRPANEVTAGGHAARRSRAIAALALACLATLGCDAAPTANTRAALLDERPRLVMVSREVPNLPGGHDAPVLMTVAFELEDGTHVPIDRPARAFVERWRDGAALVDSEDRLYQVLPDGSRRMLAASVAGELAVSDDEQTIAYAAVRGFIGELRVHDGAQERVLVSPLSSAGVLRFGAGELAFVGARPGGIAGVWLASLDGSDARCLTNCELRTGEPWMDRFVEPPSRPTAFEWRAGSLVWIDPNGTRREVLVDQGELR